MKHLLAALVLTFTLVAPALADEAAPGVEKMATDDCARARKQGKTCVLTIEDEEIQGGVPSAGENTISIAPFVKSSSLIRMRTHFIPEILKSAEDL